MPCWRGYSGAERQALVRTLIDDTVAKYEAKRTKQGRSVMGVDEILDQDPFDSPENSKKSPAPRFHAKSPQVHKALRDGYSLFYAAYRDAAEKLKAGERDVAFPEGCFPPALPFVGDLVPALETVAPIPPTPPPSATPPSSDSMEAILEGLGSNVFDVLLAALPDSPLLPASVMRSSAASADSPVSLPEMPSSAESIKAASKSDSKTDPRIGPPESSISSSSIDGAHGVSTRFSRRPKPEA